MAPGQYESREQDGGGLAPLPAGGSIGEPRRAAGLLAGRALVCLPDGPPSAGSGPDGPPPPARPADDASDRSGRALVEEFLDSNGAW